MIKQEMCAIVYLVCMRVVFIYDVLEWMCNCNQRAAQIKINYIYYYYYRSQMCTAQNKNKVERSFKKK